MDGDKFRLAIRNVQNTLTRRQAVAIVDAALNAGIVRFRRRSMTRREVLVTAQNILHKAIVATDEAERESIGKLIVGALEGIPESDLPTAESFEQREKLAQSGKLRNGRLRSERRI
jgi:hypothetical protein